MEVYDLQKHTRCVAIYIGNYDIHIGFYTNLDRKNLGLSRTLSDKACITYDLLKDNVIHFGEVFLREDIKDIVQVDNFMDKLYCLFKKNNWDEDDLFLVKAVSDFIRLEMKESLTKLKLESLDDFHYAFIVPSEWEEEIIEDVLRPLFIQSGLISKNDHTDRLLFYTDIESICYGLEELSGKKYRFKRGQNTILCRLAPTNTDTAVVKFDLIQTRTTLFDFPGSKLIPKVKESATVSINADEIKAGIQMFLNNIARIDNHDIEHSETVETITNEIYNCISEDVCINELQKSLIEHKLIKTPVQFANSIFISDIYRVIGKDLLENMKSILTNKFGKKYEFLVVEDSFSSSTRLDHSLLKLIKFILEYNRKLLNDVTIVNKLSLKTECVESYDLLKGSIFGVHETIQNCDMYCKPRILSTQDQFTSPAIFLEAKPKAIINIDISLNHTMISYSRFNDEGVTEEKIDNNYFSDSIPSLREFLHISNITTLRVKDQFISFVDKYFVENFYLREDIDNKRDLLLFINSIFDKDRNKSETMKPIYQMVYIRAFILIYMIYVTEVIAKKLLPLISDYLEMNVGYFVSIEYILLKYVIGTKDNLREILYKSGLIDKSSRTKKLRIITRGEGLLPAIQKTFDIDFPIKSYFVLAQIYEKYIQLTLNQIVTSPTVKEQHQEAIIIQDEIVFIPNIYESLCLNMWNSIMENNDLIQLCYQHKNISKIKKLEIFSVDAKTEFMNNYKKYISENLLNNYLSTQNTDNNVIQLSNSCECKIWLTAHDVIHISFKPLLREIVSVVSTCLENKGIFGKYMNIKYLFNLIHFNRNLETQKILAGLLKRSIDYFNPKRGIETDCMVIPKFIDQLLEPTTKQKPVFYKEFQSGNLDQICCKNYACSIYWVNSKKTELLCKESREDEKWISMNRGTAIPLFKKGRVINSSGLSKLFYCCNSPDNEGVSIALYKYETSDGLEPDGIFSVKSLDCEMLTYFVINLEKKSLSNCIELPLIISATPVGYSSSLQFSVKIIGDVIHEDYVYEMGQPLTLDHF